jgi:catechol 2,3-dioxygenase-like lactoylglutathione lyase family enzyme
MGFWKGKGMKAPEIDHIGIIVADVEQAAARLAPLFGEHGDIKELPAVGLRVVEFHAANVTIELLQYTDGPSSKFARQVMGERLGLNHVSARVDDVERSVAELSAAGFTPMEGFPRRGAHVRVASFEPDRLTGLLFEVCQPGE